MDMRMVQAITLAVLVAGDAGLRGAAHGAEDAPAQGEEDAPTQAAAAEGRHVEEVVVTEKRISTKIPTVDLIHATYNARHRGGQLYRRGRYGEALPHLLAAAKRGFKWEQARVSFLYQQGYGTKQDVEAAVAWLGVAARGETTPEIRGRFKELWARIPEARRPHFKAVIDEYEKRYGNKANRTDCENRITSDGVSKKRIFACDFVDAHLRVGIIRRAPW